MNTRNILGALIGATLESGIEIFGNNSFSVRNMIVGAVAGIAAAELYHSATTPDKKEEIKIEKNHSKPKPHKKQFQPTPAKSKSIPISYKQEEQKPEKKISIANWPARIASEKKKIELAKVKAVRKREADAQQKRADKKKEKIKQEEENKIKQEEERLEALRREERIAIEKKLLAEQKRKHNRKRREKQKAKKAARKLQQQVLLENSQTEQDGTVAAIEKVPSQITPTSPRAKLSMFEPVENRVQDNRVQDSSDSDYDELEKEITKVRLGQGSMYY